MPTTGMDQFLNFFGSITIGTVIEIILAIIFIVAILKHFKEYLNKKLKEETETKDHMSKILKATEELSNIDKKMDDFKAQQEDMLKRLDRVESDNKRRERNVLRERLLQSYRYYTSTEHNPLAQWTKMEQEAFTELYDDYVEAGGNGYIKGEVKPAMDKLIVIYMDDLDAVANLMHSRK